MTDPETANGAQLHYSDAFNAKLQAIWGEGYLSPGGDAAVDAIVAGLPIAGARVLDIGCGLGAPSRRLAAHHGAAHVTGFDVEAPVLSRAAEGIAAAGLSGRVSLVLGAPGPLPFAAESFDIVFSKDALIHVPDKPAIYAEALRVLRPGGWFAASDWYGAAAPLTPEMADYLAGPLDFSLQTIDAAAGALAAAGFEAVAQADRNAWYQEQTAKELAVVNGPERAALAELMGEAEIAAFVARTRLRAVVVGQGQLRPGDLRGRKPAA